MMHDVLTPLLFKREELRSVPRSERAKEKDGSRVTINSSPLYRGAVNKFYAQFTRKPLTPPPTYPSPPKAFPCPSPRYPTTSPSSSAPSVSQSEEPFPFTDRSEVQLHPSPINLAAGPASSSPSKGESIDIIDLSEVWHDVLLWAIVWVANGSKYQTTLLSPETNEDGQFSVRSLKSELGRKAKYIETYDPVCEIWRKLPWDTTVGPLHYDGRVILFRYAGVTDLAGFDRVKTMAVRLSGSKGKSYSR